MLNKDLKEIKDNVEKIKHPRVNKILESEKIDIIITKIQKLYHTITNKLIIKYNLEDELEQGKIFTILIAILTFICLIILTVFFVVTLNSILGIGLIFTFFKQILFCLKWGYTIIKNKGDIIKKYLSKLFPNSILLKEKKIRKNIPIYEEQILYQIEDFIELLNKSNLNLEVEKEITIKLKDIVNMLNIKNIEFKDEIHDLDYKNEIAKRLAEIDNLYLDNVKINCKQEMFQNMKNDVLEQINELENKIYVKKRI